MEDARKMENTKINIGNCGEYFVAAELERRGFTVAVPMSNTPSFDILAIKNDDHNKQYAIQVKTTKGNKTNWALSAKSEYIFGNNIYYIFVVLNDIEQPDYYIVPSEVVANTVKEGHKNWLNTPGRHGQPHVENSIRKFVLPKDSEYKNAWEKIL